MNGASFRIAAILLAVLIGLVCAGCERAGDEGDQAGDHGFGDHDNAPTDADDDDNGQPDADDDTAPIARFIRPELPINTCHMAATHNTFIWSGPPGGPASLVSSLGLIRALDLGQVFVEIDVTEPDGLGDFWVNHAGASQSVHLSSLLRNVRWWSDTRPDHQPIVLGFQWGAGTDPQVLNDVSAMLQALLVDPSPATDSGPLYCLEDWMDDLFAPLSPEARETLAALSPRELVQAVGYPSIRELRGRVMLENLDAMFAATPSFFLMSGEGQIDNASEADLDNLERIAQNRQDLRLSRIYPSGRILNGNFNLYEGFANGVSNNALNMNFVTADTQASFAYLDEAARGFAPAGFLRTVDGVPPRLGPPVFVTAFRAEAPVTFALKLAFDTQPLPAASPIVVGRVFVQGLSGGAVSALALPDPNVTVLVEREGPPHEAVFALPFDLEETRLKVVVQGDPVGYEIHATGTTLQGLSFVASPEGPGPAVWISPSFEAVEMEPTGRCTTLGPQGERMFGKLAGDRCDAANNPSILVEVRRAAVR